MNILRQISGYTLINGLTALISFLMLPILTRHLSVYDYGVISIFTVTTRFLSTLLPFGVANYLNIKIIEKPDEYLGYFKKFLKIVATSTGLITVLFIFSIFFFQLTPNWKLTAILTPIAMVIVLFETYSNYVIYKNLIKRYIQLNILKTLVEIALIVLLVVIMGFGWSGRIIALVFSLFLPTYLGVIYILKKESNTNLKKKITIKEAIKQSYSFVFLELSVVTIGMVDRYFIEFFCGIEETGIYGIANTVSSILLIIISSTMLVYRPRLYSVLSKSATPIKDTFQNFKIFIAFLITFALLLYFSTPIIFSLFIDIKFASAITVILPLYIGLVFWGASNFLISVIMFYNKKNVLIFYSIISILINLILNFFLISNYGVYGAASATMYTYIVIFVFLFLYLLKNSSNDSFYKINKNLSSNL